MVSSDCMGRNLCARSKGSLLLAYRVHRVVKFIDGVGIKLSFSRVPLMQSVALKGKESRKILRMLLKTFVTTYCFALQSVRRRDQLSR